MAHKIKDLFKKKPAFPQIAETTNKQIKAMFDELSQRLDRVENTLEDLVNKKD